MPPRNVRRSFNCPLWTSSSLPNELSMLLNELLKKTSLRVLWTLSIARTCLMMVGLLSAAITAVGEQRETGITTAYHYEHEPPTTVLADNNYRDRDHLHGNHEKQSSATGRDNLNNSAHPLLWKRLSQCFDPTYLHNSTVLVRSIIGHGCKQSIVP
ncbi:hypothetical protein EV401DRAFT_39650 [Pisolithus croceorrhizus]|nr:hypothetical protein EV401DRAFT_39650 [Pisolithus croceorrhizus]